MADSNRSQNAAGRQPDESGVAKKKRKLLTATPLAASPQPNSPQHKPLQAVAAPGEGVPIINTDIAASGHEAFHASRVAPAGHRASKSPLPLVLILGGAGVGFIAVVMAIAAISGAFSSGVDEHQTARNDRTTANRLDPDPWTPSVLAQRESASKLPDVATGDGNASRLNESAADVRITDPLNHPGGDTDHRLPSLPGVGVEDTDGGIGVSGEVAIPEDGPENTNPANTNNDDNNTGTDSGEPDQPRERAKLELADLIEKVEPSVVKINVSGAEVSGVGSGFVVDSRGTVVTNFHVVEGAATAEAHFADGRKFKVAGFLHVDTGRDLAVLRMENTGQTQFSPLPLAPKLPRKGETVVAFGSPKGFSFTTTEGIVSAIRSGSDIRESFLKMTGRDVYAELGYDRKVTWIQTSTPISGGNSGGPLVNLRGELVGVNTWQRPDGQNLNFASSYAEVGEALKRLSATVKPLSELPGNSSGSSGGPEESLTDIDAELEKGDGKGELYRFTHHEGRVLDVAASPDGKYLATAGDDGRCYVIDLAKRKAKHLIRSGAGPIAAVAFAKDQPLLAMARTRRSYRDPNVIFWNVETGEMVAAFTTNSQSPTSLAVSDDGMTLVCAAAEGTADVVHFIDSQRDDYDRFILRGHDDSCLSAGFSPDGRFVATAGGDGKAVVWTGQGANMQSVASNLTHHGGASSVAFSPSGTNIATGGGDGVIRIWSQWHIREGWREVSVLKGAREAITSIAYGPNQKVVAGASRDNTVRVWEVATRRQKKYFDVHTGPINRVAFFPSGRYMATASDDKTIRIWSLGRLAGDGKDEFSSSSDSPVDDDGPVVAEVDYLAVTPGEHPLPSTVEASQAMTLVREIFADEYRAAESLEAKRELARRMLSQGREPDVSLPQQHALYSTAGKVAISAGDVQAALEANNELAATFKTDLMAMHMSTITSLGRSLTRPEDRRVLALVAIQLAEAAARRDHYEHARQFAQAAEAAAQKDRDARLLTDIRGRRSLIDQRYALWQPYEAARKSLADDPENAEHNLTVGRYLCFIQADWEGGLPHLAKGSDGPLQAAAAADLQGAEQGRDRVNLAKQWLEIADAVGEAEQVGARAAALYWCEQAQENANSLLKVQIEKMIQEIGDVPEEMRRA